jgi:hypothetical protein
LASLVQLLHGFLQVFFEVHDLVGEPFLDALDLLSHLFVLSPEFLDVLRVIGGLQSETVYQVLKLVSTLLFPFQFISQLIGRLADVFLVDFSSLRYLQFGFLLGFNQSLFTLFDRGLQLLLVVSLSLFYPFLNFLDLLGCFLLTPF